MAEGTERNRDHLRAGIFVVAAMGLAIGTFVALQRVSWAPRKHYVLRFAVEDGVAGLNPGSEVRVGGLKRGTVLSIQPKTEAEKLIEINVAFDLEASLTLYGNARALRVSPILGNSAWINFTSIGSAYDQNGDGTVAENEGLLAEDGAISAVEAPGLLANIAGSKSAADIVEIISGAKEFSSILRRAPKDYEERFVPTLDAAKATITQLRDDYMNWRVKVDSMLTDAEKGAKNLEQGTESANAFIADARATLAENREPLRNGLQNLEKATSGAIDVVETLRRETIPEIAQVLSKGEVAVGEFADMLDRLDGEIAAKLPDLRAFMSDMRVAASQLKLATIEVRRSPWRLMYKPTTDVLAHEQLYEATRSFAAASGDLRTAAESLQELLRVRPDLLSDPALRDRLQSSLLDALSRYEATQRRLHGVLLDEPASDAQPPTGK